MAGPLSPLRLLQRPQLPAYTCCACLRRLSYTSNRPPFAPAPLPQGPARTRFAPSPTGHLHLGSLRTALFNYLLAKRTGGQFLLRIEDTDQKRTVPGAEKRLIKDLQWAHVQWDEGPDVGGPYGPYRQSERTAIYKEHAQKLLDSGSGYRCFCSPERLNALAEHRHKLGLPLDYDRTCAAIPVQESNDRAARGDPHTIRLKVPDRYNSYQDRVYGIFRPLVPQGHINGSSFEDPILLKSDGMPTYHLANVVDDHLMEITHVIRGNEWMPSTPKHLALYDAFGWPAPEFAHVGLLVDEQGNKLSKRNFDTDISAYREMEILPETLTNFVALLGWSHTEKSDVMDLATLTENFTLKFTKGNTTVTTHKLFFLQRKHALRRAQEGGDQLQPMIDNIIKLLTSPKSPYPNWNKVIPCSSSSKLRPYLARIIQADGANYTNANEFVHRNACFFTPIRPSSKTTVYSTPIPEDIPPRTHIFAELSEDQWRSEPLRGKIHQIIDGRPEAQDGAKFVYMYLRDMITQQEKGMRVYDAMLILGREESLARLGVDGKGNGVMGKEEKEEKAVVGKVISENLNEAEKESEKMAEVVSQEESDKEGEKDAEKMAV